MRSSLSLTKSLISLFVLVLALSACGSSDEVEAGSTGDAETTDDAEPTNDAEPADDSEPTEDEAPADGDASTGDYQVTTAQADLISPQPAPIAEIVTIDDQTIGIRYQNGSEPCALANVTITEGDSEISVALETGLHPNAAAMSCIAQVVDYEIQISLDAPIGERTIVPAEA